MAAITKKARKTHGLRRKFRWEEEEFTKNIVQKLQQGEILDTRMFLRPIFKWSKVGLRRNGQRDEEAIEKAFAFVDWMVQLSQCGDQDRDISVTTCASIQPSYALNTLITSSQRAGSLPEALRAFNLLLKYGYEPDVFAYTALIDVTARAGEFEAAIRRFEEMRESNSKPNIVTFTTIIRVMRHCKDASSSCANCLKFLADAHELGIVDPSLFSEALEVCAVHDDDAAMKAVLIRFQELVPTTTTTHDNSLAGLVAVVAAALSRKQNRGHDLLKRWQEDQVINADTYEIIQEHLNKTMTPDKEPTTKCSVSHGCLGHETSSSVREAVVHHDVLRLKQRIQAGTLVTNHDFETLIHQCRKRKWKDQVDCICETMLALSQNGCEEPAHALSFPAQPHLAPTKKTFLAMLDAFLSCGDQDRAWQIFLEFETRQLPRDVPVYRKFIRGSYLLNRCDHMLDLLTKAADDNVTLPPRVWIEIARVHGNESWANQFLTVLSDNVWRLAPDRKQLLLEELIKSCAYRANPQGLLDSFAFLKNHGFKPSATTEMAILVCCLQQHATLDQARTRLRDFQKRQMALTVPVYDSFLDEFYIKCTGRSGEFDDRSRQAALKALYERRGVFDQLDHERVELVTWLCDPKMQRLQQNCALQWCCMAESLECASVLFAQHLVQQITMIRDKQAKENTHTRIQQALLVCQDPLLFGLRTVCALRVLDLTYRSQGKIAREVLQRMAWVAATKTHQEHSVDAPAPIECERGTRQPNFMPLMNQLQSNHVTFCLDQIQSGQLTIHIVKELDEAVGLFRFDVAALVQFCVETLVKDNLDKTVSFLLSRHEFLDGSMLKNWLVKLADLYVFDGVVNTLQYFKQAARLLVDPQSPTASSKVAKEQEELFQMRRFFIRAVVARVQQEHEWASCADLVRKAIFDLDLQHEEEFLPFVTACATPNTRIAMDPELMWAAHAHDQESDTTEYLQLPLADDHVVFVHDTKTLELAYQVLMHSDTVDRIGIDAEWRPEHHERSSEYGVRTSKGSSSLLQSRVAILQLACDEYAFVFDLLTMVEPCAELFRFVFSSEEILKLGYGLETDLKRLRWSYPQVTCFDQVHNTVDFATKTKQMFGRKNVLGLSAVCKQVLGLPLCKHDQKSDWEARPLRSSQLTYAALDAFCLVMIHDKVSILLDEEEQVA